MADLDISSNRGTLVVDKRIGRGLAVTVDNMTAERANEDDIKSLKARLNAIDSTSYTAARMATMTKNDLVYALRLGSADAASI